MSQSAPGWYQDHDDPRLARWWDGDRWTEHTLVLDEQDWSTEPEPPSTRFPVEGGATAVEPNPGAAGLGDDVYAPIRDPWGDDATAAAEPATEAWQQPEHDPWAGAGVGVAAAAATGPSWEDDGYRWPGEAPGRRAGLAGRVQDLPPWAKVAVPVAIIAVVLLGLALAGVLGGDDDTPTATASSTTSSIASLGDAAEDALQAAGDGPFTTSTFTTLIPLACQAADDNDPALLADRIALLGYDATNVTKLIAGLKVGTEEYCPDKMDQAPGLLDQVAATAGAGATTSSSIDVTSTTSGVTTTTKKTTATTKKPTATTKPPVTTTTPPAPTTTQPPATTTTVAPTSSTTTTQPPP